MTDQDPIQADLQELSQHRAAAQLRAKVAAGEPPGRLNTLAAMALAGDLQAHQIAQQLLGALDGLRSAAAGIARVPGSGQRGPDA